MKLRLITTVCASVVLTLALTFAQAPPAETENGLANSALVTLPAKGGAKLTVTSPAFKQMGDIPFANTQYQTNTFPGLEWTAGPAGTQTYAIIMQDTDGSAARGGGIFLHWTAFNIKATKLDAGMTDLPSGSHGPGMGRGYMGPRTPAGPKHRYHLQVFALDTTLPAEAGASIDALTAAIKGHVLASGEIVGLGTVDPNAPARGGRGGAPGGAPGGRGGAPGGGAPGGGAPAGQ